MIAPPTRGQCEFHALAASDAADNAAFGTAVSIDGSRALVSSFDFGPLLGAGYVFERQGVDWVQTAKLVPLVPVLQFGQSSHLDGARVIVGAPGDNPAGPPASGSAFIFELQGGSWTELPKLKPGDPSFFEGFGVAVALDGDRALIGAPSDNEFVVNGGAAYVFESQGGAWVQVAKLVAHDIQVSDGFGTSVALDGDRILIGVPGDDHPGLDLIGGSVRVFEKQGTSWVPTAKITADGPGVGFGKSIALDGDRALISAPNVGRAFVYELQAGTWTQTASLAASDAVPITLFPTQVALEGDRALLGARDDDDLGPTSGSVFVFEHIGATWTQTDKLLAHDGAPGDALGQSVALSGDVVIAGAPMDDDSGSNAGSAYLWALAGAPSPSLSGAPAQISLSGGGQQVLKMRTCVQHAGDLYLLLGSTSGTTPGFAFAGLVLPLNPDGYFSFCLSSPNSPPLAGSLGILSSSATASATFAVPPGTDATLVGVEVNHAYGVIDVATMSLSNVSNAEPIDLGP